MKSSRCERKAGHLVPPSPTGENHRSLKAV
jgi:hypothetical protein